MKTLSFTNSLLLFSLLVVTCLWAGESVVAAPLDTALIDKKGRSLQAVVIKLEEGNVTFVRKSDGKEFMVHASTLSVDTQQLLQEHFSPKEKKSESPPVARDSPKPTPKVTPKPREPTRIAAPKTLKWVLSKQVMAKQEEQGLVPAPPGWDALDATIHFNDGRVIDGYVYDIRDDKVWYAAKDMVQKQASVDELTPHSRLRITQWRNRIFTKPSPSHELKVNGEIIHASVIDSEKGQAKIFTENGKILDVPLSSFDAASKKFVENWVDGSWRSKNKTLRKFKRKIKWVTPKDFTAALPFFENGHALAMQNKKWGLIDTDGSWLEAPRWDDVGDMHQGMIPVLTQGKWGYVSADGKKSIACEWDDAWRFSSVGVAIVTRDGKRGLIDRSGQVVVDPVWDRAITHSPFGIGAVLKSNHDRSWVLSNEKGELLCEPEWIFHWNKRRFELGYIPARYAGQTGGSPADENPQSQSYQPGDMTLLGIDGKPGAKPRLLDGVCLPKQPGPLLVVESGRFEFSIPDMAGKQIECREIHPASGGYSAVRNKKGKWGYADRNGIVIEPRWDVAGPFSEGLAAVVDFKANGMKRNGLFRSWPWQFIDPTGNTVIPPNSEAYYPINYEAKPSAPMFKNGRITGHQSSYDDQGQVRTGYHAKEVLSEAGNILPRFPFPKATEKSKRGLIDLTGKVVIEPVWGKLVVVSPDILSVRLRHKTMITTVSGKVLVEGGIYTYGVRLTKNGTGVLFTRNDIPGALWSDGTLIEEVERHHLSYVDTYGSDLIFREGSKEEPIAWWHADSKTQQVKRIEGASRIYWNKSFHPYRRIWVEDKDTGIWHFCTIEGKRLGPTMEETPSQWFFDEGLGIMADGPTCHFIDKEGKKFHNQDWQDARVFQHSMAAVKKDDLWGFMDRSGKIKVPCQYDDVGDFFQASRRNAEDKPLLAAVFEKGRWGYIDPNGKLVIPMVGETRGIWDPDRNHIYFPDPERRYLRVAAYDAKGNKVDPNKRVNTPRKPNPYAGDWKMFRGKNRLLGLKSKSGTIALESEWIDLTWVAPGVLAVQGAYDGGLFSPEKGWIFRDDENRRISRNHQSYNPSQRLNFLGYADYGFIVIEETPKWGYARHLK